MEKKQRWVIIGLGETGLSCVRYCLDHHIPFAINDSRANPPCLAQLQSFIKEPCHMLLGEISLKLLLQASLLLVSPGISLQHPVIAEAIGYGIPAMGDIELFVQNTTRPIVAVTGSNGKTTTVTLMAEMAKAAGRNVALGGNIGVPVLDLLGQPDVDLYCLELSSFQLERTYSLQAKVACVLNICEDHMDRYNNLEEYIATKKRIYEGCELAVVNRHDSRLYPDVDVPVISFGLDKPNLGHFGIIEHHGVDYLSFGNQRLMAVDEIGMLGRHNIMNTLSALAMGHVLSFDQQTMLETLCKFQGLPHRCQFIQEYGGVSWYNDSKATNVAAAVASLNGLSYSVGHGKIILIGGGIAKGADFSPLTLSLKKYVRKLIVLGEAAKQMKVCLGDAIDIHQVSDLQEAIETADLVAVRGDTVLLSPACSSFDMFANFEDRGHQFMTLVKTWLSGK